MKRRKAQFPQVSGDAYTMAYIARIAARRGGARGADAVDELAAKIVWGARHRAVVAGRVDEAARWLEVLAVLGDEGGLYEVEFRAQIARRAARAADQAARTRIARTARQAVAA